MKRPDLAEDGKYDGWQVLDPTPQETSDGEEPGTVLFWKLSVSCVCVCLRLLQVCTAAVQPPSNPS